MTIRYTTISELLKCFQYCRLARITRQQAYPDPPVPGRFYVENNHWKLLEDDECERSVMPDIEKWKYDIAKMENIHPGDYLFIKSSWSITEPTPVVVEQINVESSTHQVKSSISGIQQTVPGRKEIAFGVRCLKTDNSYIVDGVELKQRNSFKFIKK